MAALQIVHCNIGVISYLCHKSDRIEKVSYLNSLGAYLNNTTYFMDKTHGEPFG